MPSFLQNNAVIVPGQSSYGTGKVFNFMFGIVVGLMVLLEVHFAPHNGAESAGQALLQNYIQGTDSNTSK